jgi:hypothetical protein
MVQRFVYIVEGLGFGDVEDAWEMCEVFATRAVAEDTIDTWRADDKATAGVENEYRIRAFPLGQ